jgi:hypothetical protein
LARRPTPLRSGLISKCSISLVTGSDEVYLVFVTKSIRSGAERWPIGLRNGIRRGRSEIEIGGPESVSSMIESRDRASSRARAVADPFAGLAARRSLVRRSATDELSRWQGADSATAATAADRRFVRPGTTNDDASSGIPDDQASSRKGPRLGCIAEMMIGQYSDMTTDCETPGCMHQKRLHGEDDRCRACACTHYTRTGPGHQTKAARKQVAQALRSW